MPSDSNQPELATLVHSVNDAAKRVIAPWVTLLVAMTYMFVATFAITQDALLKNAPAKLPILNVDLPLTVFFSVAPGLILMLHFYCIVQFRAMVEKLEIFEGALKAAIPIKSDRHRYRSLIDISLITRVPSERFERWPSPIGWIYRAVLFFSMVGFPVLLLLVFQLKFLPFQDEFTTWVHRVLLIIDIALGTWLWAFVALPNLRKDSTEARALRIVRGSTFSMMPIAASLFSIAIATFPGESVYEALSDTWIQSRATQPLFEAEVDYVSGSIARWFSNRLVLVDRSFISIPPLSLRGRTLRKAVLDRSDLQNVDFTAADLSNSSLRGSNLKSARFPCAAPSRQAQLSWSGDPLSDRVEDCARLQGADFSFADVSGADFQHSDLRGSRFIFASVSRSIFKSALIAGGNFGLAHGKEVDFSYAQLQGASFSISQLRVAKFSSAELQGAHFPGAYLQGANFDYAHLQGVSLKEASLQGASFVNARLQNAALDGSMLQGASFVGAAMETVSLRCAKQYRTNFKETKVANAIFEGSCSEDGGEWVTTGYTEVVPDPSPFDMKGDNLPEYGYDIYDTSVPGDADEGLENPQALDDAAYVNMVDRVTGGLSEEAKGRFREALAILKPDARSKEQDIAETKFWTNLSKQTGSVDEYPKSISSPATFYRVQGYDRFIRS
jgi:uncharacterized protein YjbI with pentapeptide repeats